MSFASIMKKYRIIPKIFVTFLFLLVIAFHVQISKSVDVVDKLPVNDTSLIADEPRKNITDSVPSPNLENLSNFHTSSILGNNSIPQNITINLISELRSYDTRGHVSLTRSEDTEFVPVQNDEEDSLKSITQQCFVQDWNKVHTDEIPNADTHKKWMESNISRKDYLYHETPSPFAAFAYKTHIAVTLTAENQFGNKMICRYFDCHFKEINEPFESVVFPESTVFCGRRVGAEYISVTHNMTTKPEPPVKIQNREVPQHYFTVCVASLYGPEPKFIQIVDFVEYYKLQGATKIHVYVRNVTKYDRVLLDDYVRTGEVEVITVHDNWWRDDFMWHMAQINDCHFRSKYHSKWTAFVDIDERIEMRNSSQTIVDYLETITDPNFNSLQISVQWVLKTEPSPDKYISDNQIMDHLIFKRYHNTSSVGKSSEQPKCIIRPERVGTMTIHRPTSVYKGYLQTLVPPEIGVVRHYRNMFGERLRGGIRIAGLHGPYNETDMRPNFEEKLTKAILNRLNYVYNIHDDFSCFQMQAIFRKHGQASKCWEDLITELEKDGMSGIRRDINSKLRDNTTSTTTTTTTTTTTVPTTSGSNTTLLRT